MDADGIIHPQRSAKLHDPVLLRLLKLDFHRPWGRSRLSGASEHYSATVSTCYPRTTQLHLDHRSRQDLHDIESLFLNWHCSPVIPSNTGHGPAK
jgi:hypothetical protein